MLALWKHIPLICYESNKQFTLCLLHMNLKKFGIELILNLKQCNVESKFEVKVNFFFFVVLTWNAQKKGRVVFRNVCVIKGFKKRKMNASSRNHKFKPRQDTNRKSRVICRLWWAGSIYFTNNCIAANGHQGNFDTPPWCHVSHGAAD